jgi:hypothetical protein
VAVPGGGEAGELKNRWLFSARAIPGIPLDRPKLRTTLMYRLDEKFQLGLEYNPLVEEVGPLANWRILDESGEAPALMVGTSSDRIGTPYGRAYYLTLSKNLEPLIDLPVAPYVGTSYGTFRDDLTFIGGLNVTYGAGFSSMHLYDGRAVHHILSYTFEEVHTVGLMLVDHEHVGVTYGVSFGF